MLTDIARSLRRSAPSNILVGTSKLRLYSTNPATVHRLPKAQPDPEDAEDFRPPWVYTGTRLLSYTIIPTISLYAVLFYDFGDREHVFQPPRRWLAKQKANFFTLSPEEQKLLESDEERAARLAALPPSPEPTFKMKSNL